MTTEFKAPGKAHRSGMTLVELMDMFPSENAAAEWFESIFWDGERICGKCGSKRTKEAKHRKMPYWCSDCRSYFSMRTGTPMANSKISLRKWAIAIYLCLTSLKSISSMKLHRDLGISQRAAWFMLHRIRQAWAGNDDNNDAARLQGPVEVDETYIGGRRSNMSLAKRNSLKGRGPAGKCAVVGLKDRNSNQVRARRVAQTDTATLQGFIAEYADWLAEVYTDEHGAYRSLPYHHQSVKHSAHEYVRGQIHTNGVESFWSMFKRAHKGTFHKISPKHLNRYVQEFAAKHNMRDSDTLTQMRDTVARLVGRNLLYRDLIADNGLPSGSR